MSAGTMMSGLVVSTTVHGKGRGGLVAGGVGGGHRDHGVSQREGLAGGMIGRHRGAGIHEIAGRGQGEGRPPPR